MLEKRVFATVAYYSINDYPLSFTEILKFLASSEKPNISSLSSVVDRLRERGKIAALSGFYFLPGQEQLVRKRIAKQKLAIKKRRLLKKIINRIKYLPFVRLICLSGSFNIDNSKENSDFDFLVVTQRERLWLCRTLLIIATFLFGRRRHGQKTKDRACLNCFIDEDWLEISPKTKPHDFHAAQEYARLVPLIENQLAIFDRFRKNNLWIKDFIGKFPWPLEDNFFKIEIGGFTRAIQFLNAGLIEALGGNRLEKWLGRWEGRRIKAQAPTDQIFCSNHCLMLHPSSKVFSVLKKLETVEKQY